MKGVIVQVGDPKSIVLLNNGRITVIPTPAGCRVGMLVTVKLNNKLKILSLIMAAVLLMTAGIFIGVSLVKGNAGPPFMFMHDDDDDDDEEDDDDDDDDEEYYRKNR
jgi:hypothetical protein